MIELISSTLPPAVLIGDLCLVVLFLALIFRKSWGGDIVFFVGKNALVLGLLVALTAVLGSLFYSNIVGFVPCNLCWWGRILIFPQLLLFLTALKFKDYGVFKYSWRLAVLGVLLSIYNIYIQMGGNPLVPCPIASTCTKIYVDAYGFITIPSMALAVSLGFILVAWAYNKHNE